MKYVDNQTMEICMAAMPIGTSIGTSQMKCDFIWNVSCEEFEKAIARCGLRCNASLNRQNAFSTCERKSADSVQEFSIGGGRRME